MQLPCPARRNRHARAPVSVGRGMVSGPFDPNARAHGTDSPEADRGGGDRAPPPACGASPPDPGGGGTLSPPLVRPRAPGGARHLPVREEGSCVHASGQRGTRGPLYARAVTARYRLLFQRVTLGVVRTDPGGRILEINPEARSILGCDEEQLRSQRIMDLVTAHRMSSVKELEARGGWTGRIEVAGPDGPRTLHAFMAAIRHPAAVGSRPSPRAWAPASGWRSPGASPAPWAGPWRHGTVPTVARGSASAFPSMARRVE